MQCFFARILCFFVLIAIVNSHVVGPAFATSTGPFIAAEPSRKGTPRLAPSSSKDFEEFSRKFQEALKGGIAKASTDEAAKSLVSSLIENTSTPESALGEEDLHRIFQQAAAQAQSLPVVPYCEDDRIEETWSSLKKWGLRGAALAAAILAAVTPTEIGIFSQGVGILVGLPPGINVPPVPSVVWAFCIPLGAALLPRATYDLYRIFKWTAREASKSSKDALGKAAPLRALEGKTQDEASPPKENFLKRAFKRIVPYIFEGSPKNHGKKAVYMIAAIGLALALDFKTLFSFINLNLPPISPALALLVSISGLFFFADKFHTIHGTVHEAWNGWTYDPRAVSPEEKDMHDKLVAALRRIEAEPRIARQLYHNIDVLAGTLEDGAPLGAAQIVDLRKLQLIYMAGANANEKYQTPDFIKEYPQSFSHKLKRFYKGGDHPNWDAIVKAAVSLLTSPSILVATFLSYGFILLDIFPNIEYTPLVGNAGVAGVGFGLFLLKQIGARFQQWVRYAAGYNPNKNLPQIDEKFAHFYKAPAWRIARFLAEFFDWGLGTFFMLPISMLASQGAALAGLPTSVLTTFILVPYWIAMGVQPSVMQDLLTEMALRGPARAQHWLLRECGRAAAWFRTLSTEEAKKVHAFMTTAFEDWFKATTPPGTPPGGTPKTQKAHAFEDVLDGLGVPAADASEAPKPPSPPRTTPEGGAPNPTFGQKMGAIFKKMGDWCRGKGKRESSDTEMKERLPSSESKNDNPSMIGRILDQLDEGTF